MAQFGGETASNDPDRKRKPGRPNAQSDEPSKKTS